MVELYVNDIENALKNKSYFSALAMLLALPDTTKRPSAIKQAVVIYYLQLFYNISTISIELEHHTVSNVFIEVLPYK